MFRACGLDPARAEMRTLEECLGPSGETRDALPCVRVAADGEWTAFLEINLVDVPLSRPGAVLSRDGEAAVFEYRWMGPHEVTYFRRGEFTFSYSPGESYDTRAGREPERFDPELRAAGLFSPPLSGDPLAEFVGTLATLSRALGFTLTPEVARSALPTARYG
ncbi:hypothetical protein [Amycolatopsis thermoflava]|uniref:hypothetical protein n=1 Tax=Amycolatopsis thermoflava TaxID=84480 RepID=UPI0036502250